jgi:hypothetical protein
VTQASRIAKKSSAAGMAGWIAQVSLDTRLVILLCAAALGLRVLALGGIATDYDEGVYWQSLRALSNGHPLYTSIFYSQPPFFLLSLYPLYRFFALFSGQTLPAARLAIAVYSMLGLIAMYVAARMIGGRLVGLLALALLALDPFYLKESYTLQAEAPALAWQLLALALVVAAVHAPRGARRRLLVFGGGMALMLGILVKLFDVFLLVPVILYLLTPVAAYIEVYREKNHSLRFRRHGTFMPAITPVLLDSGWLLAGAVLAFLLVMLPFVGSWGTLFDQVVRYHLAASQNAGRSLLYNVVLLLQAPMEYPLIILALVSVLVGLDRRTWILIPPLLWFLACLAFLLRQQPLFDHDRLLLVPPLVLLASLIGYHFRSAFSGAPRSSPNLATLAPPEQVLMALTACVLLVSVLISVVGAHQDAVRPLPQLSVEMSSALRAATLPQDLVASDDQYIAGLADRDVPPQLVDTSQVRIRSGYLTASKLEAIITQLDVRVILFASGRFNLIPGFSSWVAANYTKIADFGDGHALYMKEPQGLQAA